jgi:phosphoribosylaminoimidazolecarboxamide formyltransferase/IMP cyclohydrolase
MPKIARALLSVYDKNGVIDLARGLRAADVALLATGGTFRLLLENDIEVTEVATHTGYPEMLDGRVKTLHPRIHGGILGRRDNPTDQKQMAEQDILPIDLVVVNLYPFSATIAKPNVTMEEAIENIDIGGPAMLRSAAKNFRDVVVVCDPDDYPEILTGIKNGEVSETRRMALAQKVFTHTSEYDRAVAAYFSDKAVSDPFPDRLTLQFEKVQTLRYGENPHQKAAIYRSNGGGGIAAAKQLWGKEMSYNNFLDIHSAYELVKEFSEPACVIVKHNNPCGVATSQNLAEAYLKARSCDPVSAFGGVVAFNRPIDLEAASAMSQTFTEVVIAPEMSPDALTLFQKKKDLRVLAAGAGSHCTRNQLDLRRISGGLLLQQADTAMISDPASLKTVGNRTPTAEEWASLLFAWRVCKHVKSNAIVFAKEGQSIGIGAGQMSRVDSVRLAALKAQDQKAETTGCVMASDAFFPFRDGIDAAAKSGITAVIQPGGSIRDAEVIAAANEHDMAMVLTGVRHFRH